MTLERTESHVKWGAGSFELAETRTDKEKGYQVEDTCTVQYSTLCRNGWTTECSRGTASKPCNKDLSKGINTERRMPHPLTKSSRVDILLP